MVDFDIADAGTQSMTVSLLVVIVPPPGGPPLITTGSLPAGTVGVAYAVTFTAAEGEPPLAWSAETSALPPGLNFVPGAARLQGTPDGAGNWSFNITVTDASARSDTRLFTLRIDPEVRAIRILDISLPSGELGIAYPEQTFEHAGENLSSAVAWSLSGGPAGLVLEGDGRLHGTPAESGSFTLTVTVTDTQHPGTTASVSVALLIARVRVVTATIPALDVGEGFTMSLAASGGAAYLWSVADGSLPPGLTLSTNGTLQGTPTAPGNYTATIRAARAGAEASNFEDRTFTLTVAGSVTPPPPPPPPPPTGGFPWPLALVALLLGTLVLSLALGKRREHEDDDRPRK
jgi:hypothetical protein